ncbi:hypothetical protein AGMMS49975_11550 [Clostridia bacterium]|nr:hypothetical protein AGMMS49975_11550 [Clostridia bacterium]
MLDFYIKDGEIKEFMSKLLVREVFDDFEVREIICKTFIRIDICGMLSDEYADENRHYATWREMKPHIVRFIKGRGKPSYLKIVFSRDEFTRLKVIKRGKDREKEEEQ